MEKESILMVIVSAMKDNGSMMKLLESENFKHLNFIVKESLFQIAS